MLKISLEAFLELGEEIHDSRVIYALEENFEIDPKTNEKRLNEKGRKEVAAILAKLIKTAERLSLPTSLKLLGRRVGYNKPPETEEAFDVLVDAVKAELESKLVLFVPPEKAGLYVPTGPHFGSDVATKFPQAQFEIDEGAKCLALGRPTASVFHMMRTLEIFLRAIAKCLSITDPLSGGNRNWGAMLQHIKTEIEARNKTDRWSGKDKDFFASAYASLDAVRVAWRNTTMHVENKYTDQEAEHIFRSVGALATSLASRLDENGTPTA